MTGNEREYAEFRLKVISILSTIKELRIMQRIVEREYNEYSAITLKSKKKHGIESNIVKTREKNETEIWTRFEQCEITIEYLENDLTKMLISFNNKRFDEEEKNDSNQ